MRDLYGVTFDLEAPDAFDTARACAVGWALDRYDSAKGVARDPGSDSSFESGDIDRVDWWNVVPRAPTGTGWWMAFRHRDAVDQTMAWRSAVELVRDDAGVHLTVRIGQESLAPVLRPAPDTPGRPRLVRDLADSLDGTADGCPVRSTPTVVRSDDVGGLVQLLLRPGRRLPVIVVTPSPATGKALTSAQEMADQLVGLAHVFEFQSAAATFELTDQIGKALSAYDGAVRVYWPGFALSDDPYVHRLWMPHTVASIDERDRMSRHALRLIGSISALRVPTDPRLRALQRQVDSEQRESEQAEWTRIRSQAQDIPAEFVDEFDKQVDRIRELEWERELLQERIHDLTQANETLSRNFHTVQLVQDVQRQEEAETDPPTTVREAVERIDGDYPESVVVLMEAFDSASETRYPHIDRAWSALRAIGHVAQQWHEGTLAVDFITAFQSFGFPYAPVSDTALGVHQADYARNWAGQRILLRWHLKLGSGGATDSILRIYWHRDDENKRFVIGHVGRHLPDSTT